VRYGSIGARLLCRLLAARPRLSVIEAFVRHGALGGALILEDARAHPQVLATPSPEALLDDFAAHGIAPPMARHAVDTDPAEDA
jgi:hypothetical protein